MALFHCRAKLRRARCSSSRNRVSAACDAPGDGRGAAGCGVRLAAAQALGADRLTETARYALRVEAASRSPLDSSARPSGRCRRRRRSDAATCTSCSSCGGARAHGAEAVRRDVVLGWTTPARRDRGPDRRRPGSGMRGRRADADRGRAFRERFRQLMLVSVDVRPRRSRSAARGDAGRGLGIEPSLRCGRRQILQHDCSDGRRPRTGRRGAGAAGALGRPGLALAGAVATLRTRGSW